MGSVIFGVFNRPGQTDSFLEREDRYRSTYQSEEPGPNTVIATQKEDEAYDEEEHAKP